MNGPYLIAKSYWLIRGWKRGHRYHVHSHAFAWTMALLAMLFLGVSVAVTITAVEVGLRNASIGDLVPHKIVGLFEAYNRIHKPTERRN